MATCIVSENNIDFQNNGSSYVKLTATDGVLDFQKQGDVDVALTGLKTILTDGSTPTNANHLATKSYVDANSIGLHAKLAVDRATTASDGASSDGNLDLTVDGELNPANADNVDGGVPADGDRVLVKNQTDASENGIYVCTSNQAPARVSDMSSGNEAANGYYTRGGDFVFVQKGTDNADTGWVISTDSDDIDVGTGAMNWTRFSVTSNTFDTAGAGIASSGSTLSVDLSADKGLQLTGAGDSDTLEVKAGTGIDVDSSGVNVTAHPATLGTSEPNKYVSAAVGTGNVTIAGGTENNHYASSHIATSDERVKKNIKTISPEDGLDIIRQSRGVRFQYKANDDDSVGVIAQEAKKLVPELVYVQPGNKDQPEDMHHVNYSGYTGYLIAANQALLARVEALEAQAAPRKRTRKRKSASKEDSPSKRR